MISARNGWTELTDILLTGDNIDTDVQENVRLHSTCYGTAFIFVYKINAEYPKVM